MIMSSYLTFKIISVVIMLVVNNHEHIILNHYAL